MASPHEEAGNSPSPDAKADPTAPRAEFPDIHEAAFHLGQEEEEDEDGHESSYSDDDALLGDEDLLMGLQTADAGEVTNHDLQQAMEEREELRRINKERTGRIALFLERERLLKKHSHSQSGSLGSLAAEKLGAGGAGVNSEALRAQYLKTLDQLGVIWDRIEQKRKEAEAKIDKLAEKLNREDEKAQELSETFRAFKREIAREAISAKTGKPLPLKQILAKEAQEEAKDRELEDIRLKHINLLNQLRRLEDEMKQKEELADGLHLIDFEQLKIENQTLNEKIEERNDELHKLRKKMTTTVQVLTHIKEKRQFVLEENAALDEGLADLDERTGELRDILTRLKQKRDQVRQENNVLRQKQGFIGSDLLVADFETRKMDLEELRSEVEELQERHTRLAAIVERAKQAEAFVDPALAATRLMGPSKARTSAGGGYRIAPPAR